MIWTPEQRHNIVVTSIKTFFSFRAVISVRFCKVCKSAKTINAKLWKNSLWLSTLWWIGIVLMLITIRPSILMPIQIRIQILPEVTHMLNIIFLCFLLHFSPVWTVFTFLVSIIGARIFNNLDYILKISIWIRIDPPRNRIYYTGCQINAWGRKHLGSLYE